MLHICILFIKKNIFMNIPKITIGIVLYKGEKYLKKCISSLLNQSYKNFELLLRDQGPDHEALAYIEKNYPEILADDRVKVFRGENLWHSGGHNKLIGEMSKDSEAYLCASNDMLYEQNFLEILVNNMQEKTEFSVFVPKLKRWNFSEKNPEISEKTNFLDSCGILVKKNHNFVDRGQGERDENQYQTGEIFGGSGALFLIQKSALLEISGKLKQEKTENICEYFDEEIHYKNDVDLAYRLQWAGFKTLFVAESVAYHDRQVGENSSEKSGKFLGKIQKFLRFLENQNSKSLWVQESSFYGQKTVLEKNFWGRGFPFLVQCRVFFYMMMSSVFLLCTRPKVLLQYQKFWKNSQKIQKKKQNMSIKNTPENIQKFFV